MKAILSMLCLIALTAPHAAHAKGLKPAAKATTVEADADDFNPFAADADQKLKAMDAQYERETGKKAILTVPQDTDHADGQELKPQLEVHPGIIPLMAPEKNMTPGDVPAIQTPADLDQIMMSSDACRRMDCHIFIDVSKAKQELNLYVDGVLTLTSPTSTGRAGFATPNFDTNPNGRIYQVYSSGKYPGYNNMPFAIFIQGGFAIHGAPGSEDKELGHVASHGCVRVRTSKAQEINRIVSQAVKEAGGTTKSVWITVRP